MDGQNYLNQISQSVRPPKPKSRLGRILSSKIFMVSAIGLGLLIVIIIIGSMISGSRTSSKELAIKLKLRIDNTIEVINDYQPKVKSSILRSNSASLHGVLTNTSRDLTDYLANKYQFKDKDVSKKITDEATLERDGIEAELFEAKINGILDRIYAHKMTYSIATIMSEEEKLIDSSSDETLNNLLTTSYSSLGNLYSDFNDFSETK